MTPPKTGVTHGPHHENDLVVVRLADGEYVIPGWLIREMSSMYIESRKTDENGEK